MHPIDIISTIANAKTAKDKAAVMRTHQHNPTLKQAVLYALDNERSYHVKELNFYPPKVDIFSTQQKEGMLDDVFGMLDRVNAVGSCGGNDRLWLEEMYSTLNEKDRELIDMVLTRKITCGAGLTKWREIWGADFLPDFPCYLSSAFDEDAINKNIFRYGAVPYALSDLKTDGQRCMAKKLKDGALSLHSRNGKKYLDLNDLEFEINMLEVGHPAYKNGWVLDGELVIMDEQGNIEPRATGNGKIGKSIKGTIKRNDACSVAFIVWDLIPMDEFTGKIPLGDKRKLPYHVRRDVMHDVVRSWGDGDNSRIHLQESREVKDLGEAMTHYAEMIAAGEEGTILKVFDGEWEPCPNKKRPNSQFKFKEEFEAEFKIVGWYHGEKKRKYENAIGGFYIESADGKVKSKCGGGLSDEIRFDENPDRFVGMIMSGLYNARSRAEGRDTWSLTHPRLGQFRPDKDEADTLERIIEQEEATRKMRMVMGKK